MAPHCGVAQRQSNGLITRHALVRVQASLLNIQRRVVTVAQRSPRRQHGHSSRPLHRLVDAPDAVLSAALSLWRNG